MLIFRFLMRFQLARVSSLLVVAAAAVVVAACDDGDRPRLAQGAAAPDFSLPGVDGKVHSLGEYAGSRVLAVVFTVDAETITGRAAVRNEEILEVVHRLAPAGAATSWNCAPSLR